MFFGYLTVTTLDFFKINTDDISRKHKEELEYCLSGYKASEIKTLDEHKMFLELLSKFRQSLVDDLSFYGKNFKKTIEGLLSVGEDGVYSNSLRFLFELIQNVDDCDYEDLSKCVLDVKFDTSNDIITLLYNESGFTPFNVFAITGIAEEAKNIAADKIEIGEKGIGFKSVFGIANSVLIESGLFAFELFSDNFIVPKIQYNGFNGIRGTRLTLKLKSRLTQGIYRELAGRYSKSDVLFTKNPILFLNKLTDIKFYIDDSYRYLKFHVERSGVEFVNKTIEENILVSVDIKDEDHKRTKKDEINCLRYTVPIIYSREACVSRYSADTKYAEKKHNIVAVIPYPSELSKSGNIGGLYSFLPTQISMNIPIALHVPYKLDSSREFIDPQGENKWFAHTNNVLDAFIKWVYIDLSSRVKEMIVSYIPKKSEHYFIINNEKVKCLQKECFHALAILNERIFYSAYGTFEKASDVISFNTNDGIEDPKTIHSYLSLSKKLFIPGRNVDMKYYGIEVLDDAYLKLFIFALTNSEITEAAIGILVSLDNFDFYKSLENVTSTSFSPQQLESIFKYEKVASAFQKRNEEKIKADMRPLFNIGSVQVFLSKDNNEILEEVLDTVDIGKSLQQYLSIIKHQYIVVDELPAGCYFAGNKALFLSAKEPLGSFASFVERFGTGTLGATLKIREESEKLNDAVSDNNMSNIDYLKLLKRVRTNIKNSYGKKVYDNYIKLINTSGVDKYRFINELLQNADDCQYLHANESPFFECIIGGTMLMTHYNEDGFTKANVRSITAIGESTKKQIQTDNPNSSIGEKGVGFKSVFTVASEVAIHSNGFHFKLTEEMPTIPQRTDAVKVLHGTEMVFNLKHPVTDTFFSEERVLALCLSLRNLKKIVLGDFKVEIDDDDPACRIIYINGNDYRFNKFEYSFIVDDDDAIEERENRQRIIPPNQKIFLYIPENNNAKSKIEVRYLYAGLPTTVQMNIPLVIDAPFEVTTSREGIIHSLWNTIIRKEVYNALIKMLHGIKAREKSEIFRFINEMGIFKNNSWLNVSDDYLRSRIADEELVLLLDGSYAAPNKEHLWIYSDICLYMFYNGMTNVPDRRIIELPKYLRTLEWIGCKRNSHQEIMRLIKTAVENGNISDYKFRKLLYSHLKDNSKTIYDDSICRVMLMELLVVPAKPTAGKETIFISCNTKIYTSTDSLSSDEFYVLDEKLLSTEDFNIIFRKDVQPMDDSQRGMLYWEKIRNMLSNNTDKKQIATFLLNEFQNNKTILSSRKQELLGYKTKIPFMFADGEYYVGSTYINTSSKVFVGTLIMKLIVAPDYVRFAEFLGCESIKKIHYDDIDIEIEKLSTEDIEDFLHGNFDNADEIIRGFISDNKIPYELILQYGLERFVRSDDIVDEYEFPTHGVKNIQKIHNDVWSAELNEITSQIVTKRERIIAFEFNKRGYVLEEYRPVNGNGIHFCQMCQTPIKQKYIVANAIEYEPAFAWEQMQLCLCLKHSKDFESFRRDESVMNEFISEILDADTEDYEPIIIPIDNKEIHFTATHLAYVQEILRRQKNIMNNKPMS